MTTEYSISVDWSKEYENYENEGRRVAEDSCKHKDKDKGKNKETNMRYGGYCDKCGFSEDSCVPVMNYAYPLYGEPSDEQIKKVITETNLTVMSKDGEYFLALCGGGMDLSQDIALAYVLCDK